jgi:hypothetical protein
MYLASSRNRLSLFFGQFTRTRFTLIFVHIKVLLNVLSDFRLHLVMQNGFGCSGRSLPNAAEPLSR